ncbi:MAG: Tellurite resistance protein TerB, partial [Magnetococcales bacterium]|nr:Tellurite resistance protein TerB [Magnetococcales bacterium]
FHVGEEDDIPWNSPTYQAGAATVELACLVALADDIERLTAPTLTRLTEQIDSWAHLSAGQRQRLRAHMRLSLTQPPKLTTLKKRLQPMPLDARHTVAKFLAHLAEADGIITPGEVKQLERIYQALQLDGQMLYADLHGASAQRAPKKRSAYSVPAKGAIPAARDGSLELDPSHGNPADARQSIRQETDPSGVRLDFARIAQLRQETEEVTTLLAELFSGEKAEVRPVVHPEPTPEPEPVEQPLFGLSPEHAAFLRQLVMRSTWSRQELSELATDMELMLDGTLELLNDVILQRFELDLYEGEDPVEILQHQPLLEKLSA